MGKQTLATRVSPYINKSVRMLSKGLGVTISEYLRRLILQDLDSRNLFDDELRRIIHLYNDKEHPLTEREAEGSGKRIGRLLNDDN